MKFVCLNCETYMNLEKVEKPEEGSLGVFFACPSCSAKFSMVTNAGETNMMNALGLKLGARAEPAASMEGLRALAGDRQTATAANKPTQNTPSVSPTTASPAKAEEKTSGCPFSAMVQASVETYARKQGFKTITLQVMDDSKNDSPNGMTWSREAEQRLDNIPDFIRPMARKEIERLAK